jgi:hypothetical protein
MSEVTNPELLNQLNAPQAGDPGRVPGGWQFGNEIDLLQGVSQGLIDPVEGLVQLAERSTGWKMAPQSVRDWARNWRRQARSTMLGAGGEVAGNVLPAVLFPAGTAAALGERAVAGAVAGAAQPVSGGGNFWLTKAGQAVLGALTGGAAPVAANAVGGIAPALGHMASHMMGFPRAGVQLMQGLASPISGLARQAAQLPAGSYGAVSGMARGESPLGTTSVSPDQPQPPPAAAPAESPPPATADNRRSNIHLHGWTDDEEDTR